MVRSGEAVPQPLFRKDPIGEQFLEKLNALLGAAQEEEEYEDLPEYYPTLHIVGVPRSGTTLMYQLLASHLDVGYVNNLSACFWRAPIYGIRLSKKVLSRSFHSSLSSTFGRTFGAQEPHEFGYFWSSELGYPDLSQQSPDFESFIDWQRLRRILVNIGHAFTKPVVFKPFLLTWHLARMKEVMPRTVFVRVKRDPVDTAQSLVKMRRQMYGSPEQWASLRPREAEALEREPYWRQVAGQVYYLDRAVSEGLGQVEPQSVLELDYEELCADPLGALVRVQALLSSHGAEAPLLGAPPPRLEARSPKADSPQEAEAIRAAVHEYFGALEVAAS